MKSNMTPLFAVTLPDESASQLLPSPVMRRSKTSLW